MYIALDVDPVTGRLFLTELTKSTQTEPMRFVLVVEDVCCDGLMRMFNHRMSCASAVDDLHASLTCRSND